MLPPWLLAKLATPPLAGDGIHAWLFSVARQLHAHLPAAAVEAALAAATAQVGRHVPAREIRDAVQNSLAVAWRPTGRSGAVRGGGARGEQVSGGFPAAAAPSAPDFPVSAEKEAKPARALRMGASRVGGIHAEGRVSHLPRWPDFDPVARRCRIWDAVADGVAGLADLWERSPVQFTGLTPGPDDWLDVLFPGADWLCLAGAHPATARTRRREKWSFGPADACALVVPSPMTGPSGRGLDGRASHRCLGNTGPRRWLVIEFDCGSLDEQASLHWHLRTSAATAGWPRLTLCVFSGGKSLHGWYGPCPDEELARELMAYAVSLGADRATWNRAQLVRLPGGVRPPVARRSPSSLAPEPAAIPPALGALAPGSVARRSASSASVPSTQIAEPQKQEVFFYEPPDHQESVPSIASGARSDRALSISTA